MRYAIFGLITGAFLGFTVFYTQGIGTKAPADTLEAQSKPADAAVEPPAP